MGSSKNPEDSIRKIAKNYMGIEKSLVNQLLLQAPNQHYITGSYRETVWKSLFDMIIPKKYCIEQGVFVIDSYGNISREVDLVVFDETYTPYIFNYGKIKFIPIEAVVIVIQCKSQIIISEDRIKKIENGENDTRDIYTDLKTWLKSIKELKTSLDSVARIVTKITDSRFQDISQTETSTRPAAKLTQTSTRPITILCATKIQGCEDTLKKMFDILLFVEGDSLRKVFTDDCKSSYIDWNTKLNHYKLERYDELIPDELIPDELRQNNDFSVNEKDYRKKHMLDIKDVSLKHRKLEQLSVLHSKEEENIIMSLTFQLNQLLMLLNNPMLFPHRAYARMFSEILSGVDRKKGGDQDE